MRIAEKKKRKGYRDREIKKENEKIKMIGERGIEEDKKERKNEKNSEEKKRERGQERIEKRKERNEE